MPAQPPSNVEPTRFRYWTQNPAKKPAVMLSPTQIQTLYPAKFYRQSESRAKMMTVENMVAATKMLKLRDFLPARAKKPPQISRIEPNK